MAERLWTSEAMQAFLATSRRGDGAAYHSGDLSLDRLADHQLAQLADALFRLSEGFAHIKCDDSHARVAGTGALALIQRRLPTEEGPACTEYRLQLRRACTPQEIADAFATAKSRRQVEASAR